MKLFLAINLIFTLVLVGKAYSQSCDPQTRDSLIKRIATIETTILKKSSECSETDSSVVCDFESAKQQYNKALAKLVLAQGIKALKSDIKSSHESILKLSPTELKEAFDSITKFENSLLKANGLQKALKPSTNGRFFDSYYDSDLDVAAFTKKKCENDTSELCSFINTKNENDQKLTYDFLENFLDTYFIVDPDQRDQDRYFKSISKNLNIELEESEQDIASYQESENFKKVQDIKKKLQLFNLERNEVNAKEIATLVNDLKDQKLNLNNETSISSEVDALVKNDVEKDISNLSSAYTILTKTDSVKNDLENTRKLIKKQTNQSISSLEEDISESFSSECQGLTTAGCINELKSSNYDNEPGIKLIRSRFKNIIETDKYADLIISAQTCMNSKEDKPAKSRCIENILTNSNLEINNNINDLKKELKEKEALVAKFSKSEAIANLEKEKVIALTALNESGCLDETSAKINCNNLDIQDFSKASIKLSTNTRELIVAFSIDEYKKLNGNDRTIASDDDIEIDIDSIDNNNSNNTTLVEYTDDNKNSKTAGTVTKKLTSRQRRLQRKVERYEKKRQKRFRKMSISKSRSSSRSSGSNGSGAFFQGFTSSLSMGIPKIMYQANQRRQIRAEAQYRREYYDWYTNNLRNNNVPYYNYGNGLNMNWGANAYNPYQASNFNGSNPYLYNNNSYNYSQYTYGSANIGNTYYNSGQNSGSSQNTNSSSSPYSFSF